MLTRRDPAKNMARFYRLAVQLRLDGGSDLIREWGRIGSQGRVRVDRFDDPSTAEQAAIRLAASKRRRGYR